MIVAAAKNGRRIRSHTGGDFAEKEKNFIEKQ